jgi:hypothetical protein
MMISTSCAKRAVITWASCSSHRAYAPYLPNFTVSQQLRWNGIVVTGIIRKCCHPSGLSERVAIFAAGAQHPVSLSKMALYRKVLKTTRLNSCATMWYADKRLPNMKTRNSPSLFTFMYAWNRRKASLIYCLYLISLTYNDFAVLF